MKLILASLLAFSSSTTVLALVVPANYHVAPVRRAYNSSSSPLYGNSANCTFAGPSGTGTAYSPSGTAPVHPISPAPYDSYDIISTEPTTLTADAAPVQTRSPEPDDSYDSIAISEPTTTATDIFLSPATNTPSATVPDDSDNLNPNNPNTLSLFMPLTEPTIPTPAATVRGPATPFYWNNTASALTYPTGTGTGTGTGYIPTSTSTSPCIPATYRCNPGWPSTGWDVCNVLGIWENGGKCPSNTLCVTNPVNYLPYCL